MILMLASQWDASAIELVRRWHHEEVRLLTCRDFARSGWEFHSGSPERGRLVVDGRPVSARDVRGVLMRLPTVTATELPHIHPDDRHYVAAELMAFLVAFLHELPCPVINQPTPLLLTGPAWSASRWRCEVRRLGMPALCDRQVSSLGASDNASEGIDRIVGSVTVIGDGAFGLEDPQARDFARRLARRAGASLLRVRFLRRGTRLAFIDANLTPDLNDGELERAVLRALGIRHPVVNPRSNDRTWTAKNDRANPFDTPSLRRRNRTSVL